MFRAKDGDHSICRAGRCPNNEKSTSTSHTMTAIILGALLLAAAPAATAQATCTLEGSVFTCTGNLSGGVRLVVTPNTPAITALNVNGVAMDSNVLNQPGVYMLNTAGGRVTINAGTPGDTFSIHVDGDNTSLNNVFGVGGGSLGLPAGYVPIPELGIFVPVGFAGVGGAVNVNNYADIVTTGNDAYGIVAFNQVGTYPDVVVESLEEFRSALQANPNYVTYAVVSVAADASNIGTAVVGSNGGTFLINADGSYIFDPGTDFDDIVLAPEEELRTSVDYSVTANGLALNNAEITVVYFLNEDTGQIDSRVEVDYPGLGIGGFDANSSVLPDMLGYVEALLADAGVSGMSAAVSILNEGSVTTEEDGAHGIYAQTIAGAGQAGKDSCTFCSSPSAGRPGADGGTVSVENNGSVATGGDGAVGIVASSRGGTGGEGGYGGPWYYGRTGGAGGRGGDLVITGDGLITTNGFQSSGILVTSEGGIGGNGGEASGGMGGGRGGRGGHAGDILIDTNMTITTLGDESHGIWARSIGGAGGRGGSAGWLGTASSGSGGNASDGGIVTIINGGEITTSGLFSYGIFGQSIGGFGGSGGAAAGLFVGWGGTGSSAGSGGLVEIFNGVTGSIITERDYSHGIFGQSIGGGGGAGGSGGGIAGIGGGAGAGGHGGTVVIDNLGTIDTFGINSRGIFAQSVGGGGGDGGYGVGIGSVGGDGAVASDGGDVMIGNVGAIMTRQRIAEAIFAQSVGGGGGTGGDSGGIGSVGGEGAGGGAGGNIIVSNDGTLDTLGYLSHGIFAQSVGGGGGNGGDSGGLVSIGGNGSATSVGGAISIFNTGGITTAGDFATGMFMQSIGGGGGNGGGSGGLVSIGGDGAGGGDGGDLAGNNFGSITTGGNYAQGVFAQTVGGSGGNGRASGGLWFSMGGSGGRAGDGGDVDYENNGEIITSGEGSQGIFAQSVGGGGGNGAGSGAWTVSIGGDGAAAGDGGDVSVFNTGLIQTSGFAAQAIFTQSVGGGGGNGGGSGAMFASLGGDGGASGDGGDVSVDNNGVLLTEGESAIGIFAQSIGGGGGNGAGSGAWFASLGGDGGAGGIGGAISVLNTGLIQTMGNYAHSIFAQSIGGGGGNGAGSGGVWVAIGGDGGAGSHGGDVAVDNSGDLLAFGFGAEGIHAESIGGGGGTGATAGALNIAIGGDGGSGSNGGNVLVSNAGTVATYGDLSHSIYAISIGGGGGSARSSGAGFFSFGGDGGSGGNGGLVTVNNSNLLATFGVNSTGIFAQSIGGGGGNGGSATSVAFGPNFSIGVAVGGRGGDGGIGQLVTINNSGSIYTEGVNGHGIFAQSVGGGGGHGGNAFSFSATAPVIPEVPVALNASVAIGGEGGNGGNGGIVDINHSGDIMTTGFRASGITAQSVGGGGGDGGNATAVTLNVNVDASATVAIGGSGGLGGHGDTVDVDSTGTIVTLGDHAGGILAQSIGGGGGAGGDATTVSIDLGFPTSPEDLIPMPGMSFDVSIGGSGGGGGNGGNVLVTTDGAIATQGVFASGIMAQSVGGGGGAGGDARTLQFDISANPTDFIPYLDLISFESTLVFGGRGGSAGNGGNVILANNADIHTTGEFAYGVVAQSVGGGGGTGGNALTFQLDTTDLPIPEVPVLDDITGLTNLSMVMAGSGGAAGDGGNIILDNGGNIFTEGDFAHGMVAQSVAGGGGLAGIVNAQGTTTSMMGEFANGILSILSGSGTGFFGSVGGSGTAGDVELSNTGDIVTLGDSAFGILAQSAAGTGVAGDVRITTSGDIFANGQDSFAIVAQSIGGTGNGNIAIEILDGMVVGGSGNGAGVLMGDGNSNSLINNGVIGSVPGAWGTAIISGGGEDRIENFGTVVGSVNLGAGLNSFDNFGWVDSGATLFIGDGNLFFNSGWLSPGGAGSILATQLTGDYLGTASSSLLFDLQFDHGNDLHDELLVSGSVVLDGTLAINLIDTGHIMPGTFEHVLITSDGSIMDSGIELLVAPSAVVSYELFASGDTEHGLRYTVDFSPSGMPHQNYMAFGNHVNEIQLAGGSQAMDPLTAALIALPDTDMLMTAYDRLSPHIYWTNQAARVFAGLNFDKTLHSCPVREGDYRFTSEGECMWMYVLDRDIAHEGAEGTLASSETATSVNFGFQKALTEHWHGALAFGHEYSDLTIPTYAEREGSQYMVGGIMKGRYGRHNLSFSASYGKGNYDTLRYVMLPTPDVLTTGDRDISIAAAHVQYSVATGGEIWYVTPLVDIGYTDIASDGFNEVGSGTVDLTVESDDHSFVTARVAVKVGGEWVAGNGTLVRPFVDVGATSFVRGDTPEIRATLTAAPDGVQPFTQWFYLDDSFTDAAAGFEVLWPSNFIATLGFAGQYGSTWDAETWYAKLQYAFD